ncbi:MAG TPA: hypothetical protein VLL52_00185 [Anaerolineae bacterium]|nr:hypothetical protein [Anaerolineae bacterium]
MSTIFNYQFDGRQGQFDVPGWRQANWYDFKNIHIPIDHADGTPTHWVYWEAEGDSYYADGAGHNKFKSPEQIFRWADFLPAHEHATLLNDIGQTYHWFHGNSPFHSRLARPTFLQKGQIELSFTLFADCYKSENGKTPISQIGDPNTFRLEMHLIDTGLDTPLDWDTDDDGTVRHQQAQMQTHLNQLAGEHDNWLVVNPSVGPATKTVTLDVPRTGLYLIVYGAMIVWAIPDGRGSNGLFAHALTATAVSPTTDTGTDTDTDTDTDTNTPNRGAPRVQYERTYHLIHNSVDEATAITIFRDARNKGRTVGFSADDAGIGDLDVRHVEVYGWPSNEHQALRDFYATNYPGVDITFKS